MTRYALALSALLLWACATAPDPVSEPAADVSALPATMAQNFVTDIDGASVHPGSGLRCPAEQMGLPLRRAELTRPDGSDMICHYHADASRLSYFLTSVPQALSEADYYAVSLGGMREAMRTAGYRVDEAATQSCLAASETSASVMRGLLEGVLNAPEGGGTIEVSPGREALVMRKERSTSLMLFDEVVDGAYLKLRYTGDGEPEALCADAVALFEAREAEVTKAIGSPLQRMLGEDAAAG